MRVHRITGDSDYINVRCADWRQDKHLRVVDLERIAPDPTMVVPLIYAFELPSAEGVVTDCPDMASGNCLVLSGRAVDVLRPLLLDSGILLPVVLQPEVKLSLTLNPPFDMGYQLYVCTTQLDALDRERTEFYPENSKYGGPNDVQAYAFRPEIVEDAGIFQVKGVFNRLFVTDRVLAAMAGHRLTGFMVRPVWCSAEGALARFRDPVIEFLRYPPGFGTTQREKRRAMRDYIAGGR